MQIPETRHEPVAQEMTQREHVVGGAAGVGVALAALSAHKSIEDVGRLRRRGREHARVERAVPVRQVGVDSQAGLGSVLGVDLARPATAMA